MTTKNPAPEMAASVLLANRSEPYVLGLPLLRWHEGGSHVEAIDLRILLDQLQIRVDRRTEHIPAAPGLGGHLAHAIAQSQPAVAEVPSSRIGRIGSWIRENF